MVELVIKIPKEIYEIVQNSTKYIDEVARVCEDAIRTGTPLPKGHGRLIDADSTLTTAWANFYKHEKEWEKKDNDYLPIGRLYDQNGFECCQQTIVNAPTILEADETESEDKE